MSSGCCGERREDTRCEVVASQSLGNGYHRLRLAPGCRFDALPGQFAMVRAGGSTAPLLRRPFSLHRYDAKSGEFEILFKIVGQGTAILAEAKAGQRLDALAPLGNGFGETGKLPLLVGGGAGVAPLMFFAEHLLANGKSPKLLLGGRTESDLLCHDEFQCLYVPTSVATEDGSAGTAGYVTEVLAQVLKGADRHAVSVHACGPIPMLSAVARLCAGYDVKCEVSLESRMACGMGACLGCMVKAADGKNVRVCKEGPVFDARELLWP